MKTREVTELVKLGLLLAGAWFAYSLWKQGPELRRAISEAVNLLKIPSVSGGLVASVKLPTTEVITMRAIVDAGGRVDGQGNFTWQGVPYQITGRDPVNGMYVSKRIVT